jgi:hypothetical protein
MANEQRADLLLSAARAWQNNRTAFGGGDVTDLVETSPDEGGPPGALIWASAALSEVAVLGHDIEDV